MKKKIIIYFKNIFFTIIILFPIFLLIGYLFMDKETQFNRNLSVSDINNEGPFIFFENDSLIKINYIKGNEKDGFYLDSIKKNISHKTNLNCFYNLDSTNFSFDLVINNLKLKNNNSYSDKKEVFAISDIEGNFKTLRDFLIINKIINKDLKWTFNDNHLVFLGDFIDRGYYSNQVLWFIYKLEIEARKYGGHVHYILGNHEILNLQGNYEYANKKQNKISNVLEKQQYELYNMNSFMGRWLRSKNTILKINNNIFTHGGINSDLSKISLEEMNIVSKKNYSNSYFKKKNRNIINDLILSTNTSHYWYRGYFEKDLSQNEINAILKNLGAEHIIVGHTIQKEVSSFFNNKIIAIDVLHKNDAYETFPSRKTEGLYINKNNAFYRVLENGKKTKLF